MYRAALRSTPRATNTLCQQAFRTAPRRFASTSPADKKRSWKSSAVRWGLAIGAVYWYTTNPAFAEEVQPQHVAPPPQFSDDDLPTVEAVVEQKRREAEARLAARTAATREENAAPAAAPAVSGAEGIQEPTKDAAANTGAAAATGGPEALEEEAGQQGAFNPETGEINWDCPCLGGMANGPCGEEFKAAFSCFVYSSEEPKGIDCIDKFQHMQDCFRQHPEVYGDELADDEEDTPASEGLDAGNVDAKATPKEASVDTTPATSSNAIKTDEKTNVTPAAVPASGPTSDRPVSAGTPEKAPNPISDATNAK